MKRNRANEPPDGGYGWVVLACCAICLSSNTGLARTQGLVLVELMDLYEVNRTQAFLVFVMIRLFSFAFAPVVGKLQTKLDASVILCTGSLLLSFSLILTSWTTAYWQVLITYGCIQGLGQNCVISTSSLTVGLYFTKRRSLALGIMYAIGGTSGFISPLLFNWLREVYHFDGALLIMGGLMLHCCAFGMLVRHPTWIHSERKEELQELGIQKHEDQCDPLPLSQSNGVSSSQNKRLKGFNTDDEKDMKELCEPLTANERTPSQAGRPSRFKAMVKEIKHDFRLFKDGLFLLLLFNRTLMMLTFYYFLKILPDFAEVELAPSVSKAEVAFVLSMSSIGDVIMRFLTGSVLDRLPWPKKYSLCGVSMGAGATVLLFQFSHAYTHLVIGSALFGLWTGMMVVVRKTVEIEVLGPKRLHMGSGFSRFIVGATNITATMLIGHLRDRLGSYSLCFTLLGGSGILGGLVWFAEPVVTKYFPPEIQDEPKKAVDKTSEEL